MNEPAPERPERPAGERPCPGSLRAGSHPLVLAAALACRGNAGGNPSEQLTLLNVSYDPTRELYEEINAAFARLWKDRPARPWW